MPKKNKRIHRTYSDDFRQDAVDLVVKQGYSFKAAAEAVNVSSGSVRKWHEKLAPEAAPCGDDASVEELQVEDSETIQPCRLLLGRHHHTNPRDVDSRDTDDHRKAVSTPVGGELITMGGASHLLTIAPDAARRRQSCIIPNLLTYEGQVVVVDLTGEAYSATSQARREMGHRVVRLDPFRVTEQESDALNPFDLLRGLQGPALESACHDVASLLPGFHSFTDVLENAAFGLVSGVVGYLASVPEKNRFGDLYSTFHTDDVVYSLAVVLDTIGKRIPKMSYCEISEFLQKSDVDRSKVFSYVSSKLKALGSQEAQKTLSASSFPLDEFIEGKPVSIYVTVPPSKLASHYSLLRIWLGMLLNLVMARQVQPTQPTLFILDECEKLGSFPQLEAAIISRGGFRIWTFWSDLRQLRSLYPASWLVGNSGALQIFGVRDYSASAELAAMVGIEPKDIYTLAPDEQIYCRDGAPIRGKQLDYLTDPLFAGR